MSGGGKSQTSTSSVSIPQEVLARYNAVNERGEVVAQQPFQPYTGEFVAPLTQTQQAGIANINQAAGMAQPYYEAAGTALAGGAAQAQPYYQAGTQQLYGGLQQAGATQQAALSNIAGGLAAGVPYVGASEQSLLGGAAAAQPILAGSLGTMQGAGAAAAPFQQQSASNILAAQAAAQPFSDASMAALAAAGRAAQPYQQAATSSIQSGLAGAQPFQQQAASNISAAQAAADPLAQASLAAITGAGAASTPYITNATNVLASGLGAASPLQQQAAAGISTAEAAGSPYLGMATQYGLAGARQFGPGELETSRYMSPYIESVAQPTLQALRQQQQMEQQKILGDQIRGGAFGGDRGRIAQAVLAKEQNLATAQAMGNIYQQGYGQALSTAQQQQQTALAAEQANRAAQQQAAQQMLGIGQQGFGQSLAAAQQRAALGQQLFGQGLSTSQQQAALGAQLFGQGATTSQQQAALAQQAYQRGMGAAQQQAALGQQIYAQNLGAAAQQAALGQQAFGQGAQTAQQQAALGAQAFGQGAQVSQQQAALAQQLFGQGATTAQQQAAVAQALFGQGATTAQQQAALGQQLFGMGLGAAGQQAGIAGQQFGQGAQAGQQLQAAGQGLFGIGAGVSQGLTGLGGAAQQAALQGGQAQLGAGTVEQQTQQALNQANYNQFLQQQGYPYQVAQFLANIAMGTGALSGSTTTTTQPSSFFSDKRLKDDIEPIGKTYDGQEIVRYRYKGEPATRIGLVAQDVEKKHPEAVGLAGGFKTVDYDKATDDAAARAPHKAYGGGLSPWEGGSMGGSVFREDAGKAYAVGGAPGQEDILAQINALVNSHQGMFPYGKAGMYGSGMGKAGPYGSTLMPAPNRGLMRAENVGTRPVSAMEGIESTVRRAENIQKMYESGKKGVGFIKEESQLSPTYTTAGQGPTPSGAAFGTPTTIRDYVDAFFGGANRGTEVPAAMYRGGVARSNYAMGGLPYSSAEDEYVPEDISAPIKPAGLQPAKPPAQGRTTGDDLMSMAKLAAMVAAFSSGGLVPRKGYQPGGAVDDLPEEWRPHLSAAASSSGVPENILRAVLRQESDYGRSASDNPFQIIESTARDPGYGVSPISLEDRARPEVAANWAARYIAARNPNVDWNDPIAASRALATNWNGGGDPNYAANVGRWLPMTEAQRASLRVNNNQEAGLTPPGLPSSNRPFAQPSYASREDVQSPYMRQALQVLQQASQREKPDWMQRNQDWLVPILSGLGTMASSPSRYLGSAILQGVAGGAQTYAGVQKTLEDQRIEREKLAQSGIERITGAGRLDVERLREINTQQQLGLRALQEFIGQYRVTREGGRVVYVGPGGNLLTQEQFQQEKNRIMRQFNLSPEQAATVAPVAPAGQPPAQTNVPGAQPPAQAPAAGAPSGQAPAPGAQPPAPSTSGLVTPAQQDAIPEAARQNQEFVNQQAAQITRLTRDANTAAARVAELQGDPATRFSPEIGTLQQQINQWNAERMRLEGQTHTAEGQVQYVIRPGSQTDYSPPPTTRQQARLNTSTGVVETAPVNLGFASNGGFPVPSNLPTRDVQITRHPAVEAARPINAEAAKEFMAATQGIDDQINTTVRLATALKLIEANGLNTNFAQLANMLNGLGFTAIANSISQAGSNRDAAFTAAKDGIMSAIQLGGRSFPRYTQNEFQTLSTRAVPNVDMTPGSVSQILKTNLADSLKAAALRRDWNEAQQNGVENFQGFFEQWRQQNPSGMWLDSAERLLGNLRGQNLPAAEHFAEGVLYVMPIGEGSRTRTAQGIMRGDPDNPPPPEQQIRPGDLFVVRNVGREGARPSFFPIKVPATMDAFATYRQAPGFAQYGAQ